MQFEIDFKGYYQTLKSRFEKESHLACKTLLRYWFVQSHVQYDAEFGRPYINLLYKREDKYGNSLTPIVLAKNKPKMSVLNDSTYSKADLYYGDFSKCGENGLDTVISFTMHNERCCVKRLSGALGGEAGEFFRELNKLALLENGEKYFVYVFDVLLKKYYEKMMQINPAYRFLKIGSGKPKEQTEISCADFGDWRRLSPLQGSSNFFYKAFSLFYCRDFAPFDYKVEQLYSNELIDEHGREFYLVVGRVK